MEKANTSSQQTNIKETANSPELAEPGQEQAFVDPSRLALAFAAGRLNGAQRQAYVQRLGATHGNQAVQRLIGSPGHSASKTIQRDFTPDNQTHRRGVTVHPVGPERHTTRQRFRGAGEIERNPQQREILDHFLDEVRAALGEWRSYRTTFTGTRGQSVFAAASRLRQQIANTSTFPIPPEYSNEPGDDRILPGWEFNPGIREYLAQHLGNTELTMLREMVNWSESIARNQQELQGIDALRRLFDDGSSNSMDGTRMARVRVEHFYTLDLNLEWETHGEGMQAITRLQGTATLHYRSSLDGLNFSQTVQLQASLAGVTAGAGSTANSISGSDLPCYPRSFGNFWSASDFSSSHFLLARGRAEIGGSFGGRSRAAQATILNEIAFTGGPVRLPFQLPVGLSVERSDGGDVQTPEAHAGGRIDVMQGSAANPAPIRVEQPRPPVNNQPSRLPTGNWPLLVEAHVSFETGRADATANLGTAAAEVMAVATDFLAQHPDYQVRFEIQGHGSPRWLSAGNTPLGRNRAAGLNQALSQARVNIAREALQAELANRNVAPGLRQRMHLPHSQRAAGMVDAENWGIGPEEDPPEWRRVDMVVRYSEYHVIDDAADAPH